MLPPPRQRYTPAVAAASSTSCGSAVPSRSASVPTPRQVPGRNCIGPTARSNAASPSITPRSVSVDDHRPGEAAVEQRAEHLAAGPAVAVHPSAAGVARLDLADARQQPPRHRAAGTRAGQQHLGGVVGGEHPVGHAERAGAAGRAREPGRQDRGGGRVGREALDRSRRRDPRRPARVVGLGPHAQHHVGGGEGADRGDLGTLRGCARPRRPVGVRARARRRRRARRRPARSLPSDGPTPVHAPRQPSGRPRVVLDRFGGRSPARPDGSRSGGRPHPTGAGSLAACTASSPPASPTCTRTTSPRPSARAARVRRSTR